MGATGVATSVLQLLLTSLATAATCNCPPCMYSFWTNVYYHSILKITDKIRVKRTRIGISSQHPWLFLFLGRRSVYLFALCVPKCRNDLFGNAINPKQLIALNKTYWMTEHLINV